MEELLFERGIKDKAGFREVEARLHRGRRILPMGFLEIGAEVIVLLSLKLHRTGKPRGPKGQEIAIILGGPLDVGVDQFLVPSFLSFHRLLRI